MVENVSHFFFNWDSLHARLKQPPQGMELQEQKHKRLKHTVNLFRKKLQLKGVLILDLKPFRS